MSYDAHPPIGELNITRSGATLFFIKLKHSIDLSLGDKNPPKITNMYNTLYMKEFHPQAPPEFKEEADEKAAQLNALVTIAFQAIFDEFNNKYGGKPRKQPRRVQQVWERFQDQDFQPISLDKLAEGFEETENPHKSAQTVISWLNAAFTRNGFNLRIERVVSYRLCMQDEEKLSHNL